MYCSITKLELVKGVRIMKKIFGVLLGIPMMLVASSVALAATITVILNPIGPLGPYAPTDFPVSYDVTGTATLDNPNINNVTLTLYVDGVETDFVTLSGLGNSKSTDFGLNWMIPHGGTFNLKVTATRPNDHFGESESMPVEVMVLQDEDVIVTECPAAPAIAGKYMRSVGIRSGSKTWQTIMKSVARETGSKGSLWAGEACEEWYVDAVQNHVDYLR
jgi:hypothetical protein